MANAFTDRRHVLILTDQQFTDVNLIFEVYRKLFALVSNEAFKDANKRTRQIENLVLVKQRGNRIQL